MQRSRREKVPQVLKTNSGDSWTLSDLEVGIFHLDPLLNDVMIFIPAVSPDPALSALRERPYG